MLKSKVGRNTTLVILVLELTQERQSVSWTGECIPQSCGRITRANFITPGGGESVAGFHTRVSVNSSGGHTTTWDYPRLSWARRRVTRPFRLSSSPGAVWGGVTHSNTGESTTTYSICSTCLYLVSNDVLWVQITVVCSAAPSRGEVLDRWIYDRRSWIWCPLD